MIVPRRILACLALLGVHASASVHFSWAKDHPTGNGLLGLHFQGSMGAAVGWAGTLVRTFDGGKTWVHVDNRLTADLQKVFFLDSLHGLVVDREGNPFHSSDGGRTWAPLNWNQSARGVHMASPSTWTVLTPDGITYTEDGGATRIKRSIPGGGYSCFLALNDSVWLAAGPGRSARTRNRGLEWDTTSLPASFYSDIYRSGGRVFLYEAGLDNQDPSRTAGGWHFSEDTGRTWTSLPFTREGIKRARYFDPAHAVALSLDETIGNKEKILASSDSGRTWKQAGAYSYILSLDRIQLNPVIGLMTDSTALIAGHRGEMIEVLGRGDSVAQGGENKPWFDGFHFTSPASGLATGTVFHPDSNRMVKGLVRTTDGGRTWTHLDPVEQRANIFKRFCFLDSLSGMVVGNSAHVLKTGNGGASWEATGWSNPGTETFCALVDENMRFVGGDKFLMLTRDGGQRWDSIPYVVSSGSMADLRFLGPDFGYLTTRKSPPSPDISVQYTTDLGFNWDKVSGPVGGFTYGIDFADGNFGIAVGNYSGSGGRYSIAKTEDRGKTWKLTAPEHTSREFNRVIHAHRNTWLATGKGGFLYYSEDAGDSWTQMRKFVSDVVFAQFVTPSVGYIMGADGELMRFRVEGDIPVAANPGIGTAAATAGFRARLSGKSLRIAFPREQRRVEAILLDSQGRRAGALVSQDTHVMEIPLQDLPPGLYFLRLRSDEGVSTVALPFIR